MHRAGVTPSQLDINAEINVRAARQHPGNQALRIALAGGAVLLGLALWWLLQGGGAHAPALPRPAAAVPAETLRDGPAAVAQAASGASEAAVPALPDPAAALAQDALPASAPMEATAVPLAETAAADSRAGKARARRATEQVSAPAQGAAEPRRGIRERCSASGNIFSELFCQSRECRAPEHANDAICTRLREIEEAQRRGRSIAAARVDGAGWGTPRLEQGWPVEACEVAQLDRPLRVQPRLQANESAGRKRTPDASSSTTTTSLRQNTSSVG